MSCRSFHTHVYTQHMSHHTRPKEERGECETVASTGSCTAIARAAKQTERQGGTEEFGAGQRVVLATTLGILVL